MSDWEEASEHRSDEPTVGTPETLPAETLSTDKDSAAPSPESAAPAAGQFVSEPPAEEPPFLTPPVDEPPFLAQPAGEPVAALELTGELRVLQAALEQPTGEMSPVAAQAAAAEGTAGVEGAGPIESDQGAEPEPAEPAAEAEPVDAEPAADDGSSLDDIAPGTLASETNVETAEEAGAEAAEAAGAEQAEEAGAEADAGEALVAAPITTVSWWPFIGYVVAWLGGAGYVVWQLRQTPAGQGVYETNLYSMSVLAGLSLLAAGPALLLIVWLASWIGRKNRRIGSMFVSALVKGAAVTLIGAIIWIGAIMLIDYLRWGRAF